MYKLFLCLHSDVEHAHEVEMLMDKLVDVLDTFNTPNLSYSIWNEEDVK